MSRYDPFYSILEESIVLYSNMLDFEKSKYQVIVQKDITQLEEMLKVEQAMIMKASVLEKKRTGLQTQLGEEGLTLLEMAEAAQPEDKERLLTYRSKLLEMLESIKEINAKSLQLVDLRLKNTEATLERSGYIQDLHTYDGTGAVSENNAGINKSLITKNV